jgi:hypothetical protein
MPIGHSGVVAAFAENINRLQPPKSRILSAVTHLPQFAFVQAAGK